MPRISKETNTADLQIGQPQEFIMSSTGDIDRDDYRDKIDVVDTPVESDRFQELAFMEEFVVVEILKGGNPKNEEQFVQVGNNGVNQFIERGVPTKVRRKFVEVLARAKRDDVQTPEFVNSQGQRDTKIQKVSALLHNFVVRKDSDRGHAWLAGVLAEA